MGFQKCRFLKFVKKCMSIGFVIQKNHIKSFVNSIKTVVELSSRRTTCCWRQNLYRLQRRTLKLPTFSKSYVVGIFVFCLFWVPYINTNPFWAILEFAIGEDLNFVSSTQWADDDVIINNTLQHKRK